MPYSTNSTQRPLLFGFAAYACAHVILFSLIGMLALPLPAIWWACLALVPCWLLMQWLKRFAHADLAHLVGISAAAFAGGVMGIHGRELFCLFRALI
ncbi:hypothetical protein NUV66_00510 [Pseudomonas sp. 32.2.56]|uniref:hypothetical protein n=1 Tax=Pseudomonas sp. 32.2.56 TaxID=2969303 RepID=UPI002150096D|nr:hypothetical protein [Pseudomonas sp. 32.2.56]MCR4507768.1 hypothetical protein [Pseudomonas sp. 32.2.56]